MVDKNGARCTIYQLHPSCFMHMYVIIITTYKGVTYMFLQEIFYTSWVASRTKYYDLDMAGIYVWSIWILILAHELWFCVLILWLDKIMCLKLHLEFESFYTNHHMSWLPSLCDLHSNVYNSTYEELITWPILPSWKTQPVSKDK